MLDDYPAFTGPEASIKVGDGVRVKFATDMPCAVVAEKMVDNVNVKIIWYENETREIKAGIVPILALQSCEK